MPLLCTGIHASSMFRGTDYVASTLQEAAARMEVMTGHRACRAFPSARRQPQHPDDQGRCQG